MGTFKDSLKKWFYTQGTQAASSTARVPLLDASGNPIGSDTMGNLASVLGVKLLSDSLYEADINTLTDKGVHAYDVRSRQGSVTNCPDSSNECVVLVVSREGTVCFQICLTKSSLYIRRRWSSTSWGAWINLISTT